MKPMNRIKEYIRNYRFNSLFIKNLFLLLLLIIVPLTGAFILAYYAYDSMQKNELRVYNEQLASDTLADMDRIIREAGTELIYIGFNSNVELYMYDDEEVQELNYKIKSIQELIRLPVISRDYINSIYVYSAKSNKVISIEGISSYDYFEGKECLELYRTQQEDKKKILVTPDYSNGFARQQISVYQEIRYGHQGTGLAVMNLDMDSLAKELAVTKEAQIYITDGTQILFSNQPGAAGQSVGRIPGYTAGKPEGAVIRKDYCLTSAASDQTGLQVITYFNLAGYQNKLSTVRNFMLTFLLLMLLMTAGLATLISVRIFRPIGAIMTSIEENRNVLLGEEDLLREKDELNYILHSIQKTATLKKDVDQELSERVRLLKKAQAVALQSQINPHFFNNTLDTVNWMAIGLLGGKNEISEMTGALSHMLRMSLESTDTIVPLRTEMDHCRRERPYNCVFLISAVIHRLPAEK